MTTSDKAGSLKRVIYKYKFGNDGKLIVPAGDVRLVASQDGSELPTIWIEHDVDNQAREYEYTLRGTGWQFDADDGFEHVGSAVCGRFVWHVYRKAV